MTSIQRPNVSVHPGTLVSQFNAELAGLVQGCFASRLFEQDQRLFGDAEERVAVVNRRLGWVNGATWIAEHADLLEQFALEIQKEGFAHVLLLGMGGSSLCPEVLSHIFKRPAHLKSFDIVDSTDPAVLRALTAPIDLRRTLFVVASKSGSTVETMSQARHFLAQLSSFAEHPGRHFVAITDAGSALEQFAEAHGFRRTFLNPEDIGGRYSALSYFGMVPAALLGLPLRDFASEAQSAALSAKLDQEGNMALKAGALLGAAARSGVDKLTFVASKATGALVPWIEQLVAESTGKLGRGIVPIEAEPVSALEAYGSDRLFCTLRFADEPSESNRLHAALANSNRPWIEFVCGSRSSLAAVFLIWECVTAAAGRVLDINPFDEPNVKESKDNTLRLLSTLEESGRLPVPENSVAAPLFRLAAESVKGAEVESVLSALVRGLGQGDYLSFLYFGGRSAAVESVLQSLRQVAGKASGVATLRGYGPRYLHSIGQLYKGGAATGHFVVLLAARSADLPIPDARYSFGQLLSAQALGDYQALVKRRRPSLWVHLSEDTDKALGAFADAFRVACSRVSARA